MYVEGKIPCKKIRHTQQARGLPVWLANMTELALGDPGVGESARPFTGWQPRGLATMTELALGDPGVEGQPRGAARTGCQHDRAGAR